MELIDAFRYLKTKDYADRLKAIKSRPKPDFASIRAGAKGRHEKATAAHAARIAKVKASHAKKPKAGSGRVGR